MAKKKRSLKKSFYRNKISRKVRRKVSRKSSRKRHKKKRTKRLKMKGGSDGVEVTELKAIISVEDSVKYKTCPNCEKKSRLTFGKLDSHNEGCIFRKSTSELDEKGLEIGFDEQDEQTGVFYIREKGSGGSLAPEPHTQSTTHIPDYIQELSKDSGIPVGVLLKDPSGITKALQVIALKNLSPPKEIEKVYDENGSLMYTVVEFDNKLFAAYEGEPDTFLTGVKYTDKVTWMPFSLMKDKVKDFIAASHTITRQIFVDAASENTLDAWDRRGIPPILLIGNKSEWEVNWDGCHRINAVMLASKTTRDIGIPVTFESNNNWREPGPVYYSVNKSKFNEPDLLKLKRHFEHGVLNKDNPLSV